MGSQRTGVVIVVAIIVVAVAAGVFGYKEFGSSGATVASSSANQSDRHDQDKQHAQKGTARIAAPTAAPDDPAAPHTGSGEVDTYRQYEINGKTVRDHRAIDGGVWTPPPDDKLPVPRAPTAQPDGREVAPLLTQDLGQSIKRVMRECAAQIPKESRGAEPRMLATITLAVRSKTATITAADIVLRDVVAGPSADTATACLKQKLVGVSQATDEADVAAYDLSISYLL